MEYGYLGRSGLQVSRIIFGCMTFGDPSRGAHEWSLPLDESRPLFRAALDAGVTVFDTANFYSEGTGEEILGTLLAESVRREDVVVATKVHFPMGPGSNGAGLSRGAILTQVDASLRRLQTDYIDLYQIHRADPNVPVEETMQALHDLVRAGKVRYIGASSMWAWQFAEMQHTAELHGWTKFVSMQNQLNLLMREEEREMLPYCRAHGFGVIPWSPLARGRLTRDWDVTTRRSETDEFGLGLYRQAEESDRRTVEAVAAVASERGVSRAQVALAWVMQQPGVSAPVVGVTKQSHLGDAVAATELRLTEDELTRLGEHYVPHAPEGFS